VAWKAARGGDGDKHAVDDEQCDAAAHCDEANKDGRMKRQRDTKSGRRLDSCGG
jgi:hypothetical protein